MGDSQFRPGDLGSTLNSVSSLANAFAYWQGASMQNATKVYFDDIGKALQHIQDIAGDNAKNIQFANGETGWPTGMILAFFFFFFRELCHC